MLAGEHGKPVIGTESFLLRNGNAKQVIKVQRLLSDADQLGMYRGRVEKIRKHFGNSPSCLVPRQHWEFIRTKEGVKEEGYIEPDRGFLVGQQELVPEVRQAEHLQFCASHLERWVDLDTSGTAYTELNKALLALNGSKAALPLKEGDPFAEVMKYAKQDPRIGACVADFTRRAIAFCTDTGETLDLGSPDNISLIWRNNGPKVALIDPLYPAPEDLVELQRSLVSYCRFDKRGLGKGGAMTIRNGLHCVRLLNAMAQELGLPDRLDICHLQGEENTRLRECIGKMQWHLLCQRMQALDRDE